MNEQNQINKPLVCARCITYNQAPYIVDALNGFCMQQTTFPFVCAIIDDCSTDDEQEVIRNYLHDHFDLENKSVMRNEETGDYTLTYAQHKTNPNCFFAVLYLKYNHYSIGKAHLKNQYIKEWLNETKYIALCEGDDYWTDPLKLQKQVDVMEENSDCTICFAQVAMTTRDGCKTPWLMPENGILDSGICTLEDFTKLQFGKGYWVFHTSSFLIRTFILEGYDNALSKNFGRFPYSDLPIILYSLHVGDGYYIKDLVSHYRLMSGGYNSMRKKNVELDINHGEMIIQALKDFNFYTNCKYNKYIKKAILRNQIGIDRLKHKPYYLNIKYLPLLSVRKVLLLTTKPLKIVFPSVYSNVKKIYWKLR